MKQVGEQVDLGVELKIVRGRGAAPELVQLAEVLTGPAVISVYMRNNTGSCDKQNDALVEVAGEIKKRGYQLIAVSRDTAGSHGRYAEKKGIDYTLVSDPDDRFAQAVDAVIDKQMYGRKFRGPLRSAWVLAADGTVEAIIKKVDAKAHGEQVLGVLDGLKQES